MALKWAQIERFATQAYAQGAALSLPDIAYLVSASASCMDTQSPEAVDAYLRTFDKLLIFKYYGLPIDAVVRVLGLGRKLIEGHLELVDKHFQIADDLKAHLSGLGVSLENIC